MKYIIFTLLAVLTISGCTKTASQPLAESPYPPCNHETCVEGHTCIDQEDGTQGCLKTCTSNADCPHNTPVCDISAIINQEEGEESSVCVVE